MRLDNKSKVLKWIKFLKTTNEDSILLDHCSEVKLNGGRAWHKDDLHILLTTSSPHNIVSVAVENYVRFIALYANFDEDLCLIPESCFYLEGAGGEFGNRLLQDVSLYISKIKVKEMLEC